MKPTGIHKERFYIVITTYIQIASCQIILNLHMEWPGSATYVKGLGEVMPDYVLTIVLAVLSARHVTIIIWEDVIGLNI